MLFIILYPMFLFDTMDHNHEQLSPPVPGGIKTSLYYIIPTLIDKTLKRKDISTDEFAYSE